MPSTALTTPSSVSKWTLRSSISRRAISGSSRVLRRHWAFAGVVWQGRRSEGMPLAFRGSRTPPRGDQRAIQWCRGAWEGPLVPDSWIEECVHDVHYEVHEDDGQRRDQDGALHDRQVALLDRVVGEAPDARDVEDGLREDRAAEQDAEVEPEDRHDRRDGGAEAVLEDDLAAGQALGP